MNSFIEWLQFKADMLSQYTIRALGAPLTRAYSIDLVVESMDELNQIISSDTFSRLTIILKQPDHKRESIGLCEPVVTLTIDDKDVFSEALVLDTQTLEELLMSQYAEYLPPHISKQRAMETLSKTSQKEKDAIRQRVVDMNNAGYQQYKKHTLEGFISSQFN
jgi:hypothetical protein